VVDPAALELIRSVFGEDESAQQVPSDPGLKLLLKKCQAWYLAYINWRIEGTWESLIEPVLGPFGDTSNPQDGLSEAQASGRRRLYEILTCVADVIRSKDKRGLALADIVTLLKQKEQLRESDIRSLCLSMQLVFSGIGWLTMLYEPVLGPESNKLQLQQPKATERQRRFRTNVISNFSQNFSIMNQEVSIVEQPFHRLLHRFGTLVPCPDEPLDGGQSGWDHDPQRTRSWRRDPTFESTILVPHVCYHTLMKVIRIRIQWVDSLNLHLEFHHGTKTLKLFRYPAFCWLMYRNGGSGDILLSR
jgi:hypothetical protein